MTITHVPGKLRPYLGEKSELYRGVDLAPAIDIETELSVKREGELGDILTERGKRYGSFEGHARISQALKGVMRGTPQWESLPFDMQESLEMVQHKIARILNGDPHYKDSWRDIGGYSELVVERLTDD